MNVAITAENNIHRLRAITICSLSNMNINSAVYRQSLHFLQTGLILSKMRSLGRD